MTTLLCVDDSTDNVKITTAGGEGPLRLKLKGQNLTN